MTSGLRYLPAPRRGRRRIGALGLGVLAAMSLVWQQQATLASYVDTEYTTATFTAATLEAITPVRSATAAKVDVSWPAASGSWAVPQYSLGGSASASGSSPTPLYAGTGTSYTHDTGTATPTDAGLNFTDVAAGDTHACGISQGSVYCWGTASSGLGNGANSASTPAKVNGLSGRTATQVTAGTNFTCAIADGAAYCWGLGTFGQLGDGTGASNGTARAVTGLSGKTVTSLSAGGTHACAVADGAAYCWGRNNYGQLGRGNTTNALSAVAALTDGVLAGRRIAGISAGVSHTCAVGDGRAFCWGRGTNGRLGNGLTTGTNSSPLAVSADPVLSGRTVTAVSAGNTHSCAVADGRAYCWGDGTNGRLGNAGTTQATTPQAVVTSLMTGSVKAISAGNAQTCAVAGGNAYCWGAGANYGLGNGATADQSSPVATNGSLAGRTVVAISAGSAFGCATGITPAACWGYGAGYRLGDGSTSDNQTPVDVSLSGKACPGGSVRLSDSSCSLAQDTDYFYRLAYSIGSWIGPGSAWVKATTGTRAGIDPSVDTRTGNSITLKWAAAPEPGQAYPEYTVQRSTQPDGGSPVTVGVTGNRSIVDRGGIATSRNFAQVSAGSTHTCAVVAGELYCWGRNNYGQLGIGSTTDATSPARVTTLAGKTVTEVSAGLSHTCAIADDKAYCWGRNNYGQLGDGTTTDRTSPLAIPNQAGYTATAISAGDNHSCGIGNGVVYCWGYNSTGQLGTNNYTQQTVPTPVTSNAVFTNSSVTAASAGGSHSCAVKGSRAFCWGFNTNGQLGNSTTTTSTVPTAVTTASGALGTKAVTALSAGSNHTCVIGADKAYCWGSGGSGQLGNGSYTANVSTPVAVSTTGSFTGTVTAISAGGNHSCAVAGQAAFCWGVNTNGQLGNNSTTTSSSPVAVTTNGALSGATATDVAAGAAHSCSIAAGAVYCWGLSSYGRLGVGGAATTTNAPLAQPVAADARCAAGAVSLGNGLCSLAPGSTYYYRVSYTLDGTTTTRGGWTPLATS